MRELSKKIVTASFIVFLFFAGLIALTQESDDFDSVPKTEPALYETGKDKNDEHFDNFISNSELARETPEWVKPARWFRSNAGGMALEEIPSHFAALRNEYALVIDFTGPEELPDYLLPYYESSYFIEIRKLYKQGKETRMQWIFRDKNGTTRLIAAFSQSSGGDKEINETEIITGINIDNNENENLDDEELLANNEKNNRNGFIEIFDENAVLLSDYRFFDDGVINKTEYRYKDGVFISAHAFLWEEDEEGGEFAETYADFFHYNRSSFLRSVERVFYREGQISQTDDSVLIAFPYNIVEAARNDFFISEKLNSYPEFFGDVTARENSRIVSTTDERGRILTQTFYDEEDNVIWFIRNTWLGDRIVSAGKTEGGVVILAEYEYDSGGNRILERNFRNGVLERVVMTENNRDIEQLYINGVAVLQAVWEDGRKISETRIRN